MSNASILNKKFFFTLNKMTNFLFFSCFLPEWEQCIPCAINRKNEVILFLWMDIALLCVVFIFSLYQWHLTKNSSNLAVGHFFENLMKTTNVAFDAAGRKTKNRKGNQGN